MREQFVTYEIALKLKELGFNEECLSIYINSVLKPITQNPISGEYNYKFKSVRNSVIINQENCSAPLWQQAIDWLREKHDLFVLLCPERDNGFGFKLLDIKSKINLTHEKLALFEIEPRFNSYEEAREQAILKAIELIEQN